MSPNSGDDKSKQQAGSLTLYNSTTMTMTTTLCRTTSTCHMSIMLTHYQTRLEADSILTFTSQSTRLTNRTYAATWWRTLKQISKPKTGRYLTLPSEK